LQQSNLGNFTAADRLFAQASDAASRSDGLTQRLIRNYRAINQLNQRRPVAALKALAVNVDEISDTFDRNSLSAGLINMPLAEEINRENKALKRLGAVDPGCLIQSAQRSLMHRPMLCAPPQHGFKGSLMWRLRASPLQKTGLMPYAAGALHRQPGCARKSRSNWPCLPKRKAAMRMPAPRLTGLSASLPPLSRNRLHCFRHKARKAGWLGRTGDEAGALTLYAKVVEDSQAVPDAGTTLRQLLAPYFSLLARRGMMAHRKRWFNASQVLQRPGVAQTQAVLARQLSEGNDEAASLFRLSVTRTREIARTEATVAALSALEAPTPQDVAALKSAQENLASMQRDQTGLVSKLAAYPRYNVLAPKSVDLPNCKARSPQTRHITS
jgi:hypothetical protein